MGCSYTYPTINMSIHSGSSLDHTHDEGPDYILADEGVATHHNMTDNSSVYSANTSTTECQCTFQQRDTSLIQSEICVRIEDDEGRPLSIMAADTEIRAGPRAICAIL